MFASVSWPQHSPDRLLYRDPVVSFLVLAFLARVGVAGQYGPFSGAIACCHQMLDVVDP